MSDKDNKNVGDESIRPKRRKTQQTEAPANEPAQSRGVNSTKPTRQRNLKAPEPKIPEPKQPRAPRRVERADDDEQIRLKPKPAEALKDKQEEKRERKNSDGKLFRMLNKIQGTLEKMSPGNKAGGNIADAPAPFSPYEKKFMSMPLEERRRLIHEKQRQFDEATRNRTIYGRIGGVGRGAESALNTFADSAQDSFQRKALSFMTGGVIGATKSWARRLEMKHGISFARNFELPDDEKKKKEGDNNKSGGPGGGGIDHETKQALLSIKGSSEEIVKAVKSIDQRMAESTLDKAEAAHEAAAARDAQARLKPGLLPEGGPGGEGGSGGGKGGILGKLAELATIADGVTDIIKIFKRGGGRGLPGGLPGPAGKPGILGRTAKGVKDWFTGNPNGAVQGADGKWRLPKGSTAGRGGSFTSAPRGNVFQRGGQMLGRGLEAAKNVGGKGIKLAGNALGKGAEVLGKGGAFLAANSGAMGTAGRIGMKGLAVAGTTMDAIGAIRQQNDRSLENIQQRGGFGLSALRDFGNNASFGLADKFTNSKAGEMFSTGFGDWMDREKAKAEGWKNAYNGAVSKIRQGVEKGAEMMAGGKHTSSGMLRSATGKVREILGEDGTMEKREGGTLAWRNNNPGNLRYGKFARKYGAVGKDDKGFAVFPSREAGDAAQKALLRNNYWNHTLAQMIYKYAPPSENNTSHYLAQIVKATGASASTKLSELSEQQFEALRNAMKKHEGWKEGQVTKSKADPAVVAAAKAERDKANSAGGAEPSRTASTDAKAVPKTAATKGAARTAAAAAKRDVQVAQAAATPATAKTGGASPGGSSQAGGVPSKVAAQVPVTRNPDSAVKRIQQQEMAGRAV